MHTTAIGNRGEQYAAEALVRLGYTIIDRNWKTKWAEIDIIAQKQTVLYFIEVKFRATTKNGDGFDYITDQKLARMYRAAELWVVKNNWNGEYALLAASVSGESNEVDVREIA